ncbi:MAG TPA: type II secretion system F family protein [Mobilitalea sp.]|nr:type II secretion system F family protein [Mobilitalea sp.]
MLYINMAILLVYALIAVISKRGAKEWLSTLDKKEHKLYLLYPMSRAIINATNLEQLLLRKTKVTEAVKALNVTAKTEEIQKLYLYSKTSLTLLIIFLFNILSLMGQLSTVGEKGALTDHYLERPSYGEGSSEVDLRVTLSKPRKSNNEYSVIGAAQEEVEQKDEVQKDVQRDEVQRDAVQKDEVQRDEVQRDVQRDVQSEEQKEELQEEGVQKGYSKDIAVIVTEKEYTEEELDKAMEKAILYLDKEILGENDSKGRIIENLAFINQIPGTSIGVEWWPEDYNLITSEGCVNNEDISPEGVDASVKVVLTYKERKEEHWIQLKIMPKPMTEEEWILKELDKELQKQSEASSKEDKFKLPEQLEGYSLSWESKAKDSGIAVLVLGIVAAVLIWFYSDRELENKLKKRKTQMLLDYPEIINKFTLLLNAGMTIRQAWSKIAEDYSDKANNKIKCKRYAYEEMVFTVHELKLGIPEGVAYEQFGKRTGVISYLKFGSLIAQNLKKGSRGLAEILSREVAEAFEERKELAKRLGEEAGTKLLAPMMLLLLIVLVIIMVPAFMSFGA